MEPNKTGTTIVGMVCKDGVVLAADRRTTAGHLVVGKKSKKIDQIAENMAVGHAGLVSDAQLITRLIKAELKLKDIQTNRKTSVHEAAHLISSILYGNIRRPSMVAGIVTFLLGGYDEDGSHLINLGIDGSLSVKDDFDTEGSGSVFAFGVLESQYKKGMSIDEGISLAFKAVNAAMQRDTASGNGIHIYAITKDGVKLVEEREVNIGIQQ